MNVLDQLLKDNSDECNTRYNMLNGAEVSAIVEAMNCQFAVHDMWVKYVCNKTTWRAPEVKP